MEVSYTTAFGQSFDAADTVSLFQPAQVSLDLDYTSLYVWNSSSMRVDLSVDGAYCTTLAAGASLQLALLHADSVVTASCTTDAGETLTSSVTAASRSFEVLFSLGTVDVYNDYNADMLVRLNGADYCTIPAQTLQTINDISLGSTLSFTLTGEEVFSPYDYQLIYDYDSICPILDLSEDAELAVSAVLQDELTTAPLTGEDNGLLGGFDRLLLANGWSRSEVVVSDVTVENVYAMDLVDGGILRGLLHLARTSLFPPPMRSRRRPQNLRRTVRSRRNLRRTAMTHSSWMQLPRLPSNRFKTCSFRAFTPRSSTTAKAGPLQNKVSMPPRLAGAAFFVTG